MFDKISISFAGTLVIQLFTMLGGILSARLLLPQGKGELTAILLWPTLLASVGSLGVVEAITYFSAARRNQGARTLSSGVALSVALSACLMGVGYVILPMVLSENNAVVVDTARVYLAYIPLNLVALSLMAVLLGKMRILQYNILRAFVHVSFVAAMVLLYVLNRVSVHGLAVASLMANLSTLVMAIGFMGLNRWLEWKPDLSAAKDLLTYGLKVHVGSVASFLNLRLDQLVMSIFLQPSVLGFYVVAVTVSGVALLGSHTLALLAFPHISGLNSRQDKWLAIGQILRLGVLLSLIAAVFLFFLAPWILTFFFGVAFLPARWPARILLLASIPLSCNVLCAAGFKALGHPLVPSKAELLSLAVTGVSLWLLLPKYQAVGAALSSLLAYLTSCLFMLFTPERQAGISLGQLFRPTVSDWQYGVRRLMVFKDCAHRVTRVSRG